MLSQQPGIGTCLVRQLAAVQPLLSRCDIIKELHFQRITDMITRVAKGQDVSVGVGLHYMRYVAEPQLLGLRQLGVLKPARRVKPGAL